MSRKSGRSGADDDDYGDDYDDYDDDYYDGYEDYDEDGSTTSSAASSARVASNSRTTTSSQKAPAAGTQSKGLLQSKQANVASKKDPETLQSEKKGAPQKDSKSSKEGPSSQDSKQSALTGIAHLNIESDDGAREQRKEKISKKDIGTYTLEKWIIEATKAERKPLLHLIFVGHVDAGKSTLMGHLLHLLGRVPQKEMHKNQKESKQQGKGSFAYAWILDEGSDERARGMTMTVAVTHFETAKRRVVLLDAPGHRDFVPNMLSGAAQADAAVLVVDAWVGGFEAGVANVGQNTGQTREHAQLIRSLGVEQLIVAVNKMDAVNYSEERYNFIKQSLWPILKQCGFKESAVRWIPVSALDGQNLTASPTTTSWTSWYSGLNLVEAIDTIENPARNVLKPLRITIAELVKIQSAGQASASGKLESGAIQIGSKVMVMPTGAMASVKSIEQDGKSLGMALAGDNVDIGLIGVEPGFVTVGGIICHPDYPTPVAHKLEVKVVTLAINIPILRGRQVVLHAHHARESTQISNLVAILDQKTGEVTKNKPRCLLANQSALIEVVPERPLCLEEYAQFRALGRVVLRDAGRTLAVGIVTRIHTV